MLGTKRDFLGKPEDVYKRQLLDILRITGRVYEPNKASRRVLEKNGFELEGLLKQAVDKNGNIYLSLIHI